nr:uncharacterized protein LOC104120028 [Nicotiana tomentosiformis]
MVARALSPALSLTCCFPVGLVEDVVLYLINLIDHEKYSVYAPDPSGPLFLHSSDVPSTPLVHVPFSEIRCNNMLISWLTSSLSPEIAESVQYFETAETKPGLQQEVEENKLYQFLMGLNKTYMNVRSNLLMMQPPPSLGNAYNILLQDESQRHVKSSPHFNLDSASFNANTLNKIPPQRQYNQRVNFEQRVDVDQVKASLFCKYCKKPGQLIEKCYKLHGYPSNLKFNKGRRIAANASDRADFLNTILIVVLS